MSQSTFTQPDDTQYETDQETFYDATDQVPELNEDEEYSDEDEGEDEGEDSLVEGSAPSSDSEQRDEKKSAPKTKVRRGPDRGLIRRSARKVVELQSADPELLTILAAVFGSSSVEPVDLAVEVLSANRTATIPVSDLVTLSKVDAFEVSVEILSLGRQRSSAVWALAHSLGMVDETMPSAESKAAVALARALQLFGAEQAEQLESVVTLAKRQ